MNYFRLADRLAERVIATVPNKYVKAYLYGIVDGWTQPYEVNSSHIVEHLIGDNDKKDVCDIEDRGINLGQFLRAGRKSQSYIEYGFGSRSK